MRDAASCTEVRGSFTLLTHLPAEAMVMYENGTECTGSLLAAAEERS